MNGHELAECIRGSLAKDDPFSGATEAQIKEAEERLSFSIPTDMRAFLGNMNGASECTGIDHGAITFWSLSEMKTVKDELQDEFHEDLSKAIVFADHLHWCWAFAGLNVPRDDGRVEFHVYIIGIDGGREPIARSFTDFVTLVLRDDVLLYSKR